MSHYKIDTGFIEIVSGTNNMTSRAYMEAAKEVDNKTPKAMRQLKNFITSIENLAAKDVVKDSRISGTKGNITAFAGYDNIKTAMDFLSKNLGKIPVMQDLDIVYKALTINQTQYTEGYEKNVRLIVLEYESAVYLLVTGLSMAMADSIGVSQNGTQIRIEKKAGSSDGPTIKTLHEFAKQLGNKSHKEYLEGLLKGKENVGVPTKIEESATFMESTIADTIDLIDAVTTNIGKIAGAGKRLVMTMKNTIFGIVPLIRSVLYLRYKKKADTILALDQQVNFINMNIEQLQNIKSMDEAKKAEIIKKQKAVAEQYQKKAAKLRAQLTDGEREATEAIKKEDPEIKKVDDGDFVWEGVSVSKMFGDDGDYFAEAKMKNKPSNTSTAFVKKRRNEAFQTMIDKFHIGKKSSKKTESEPEKEGDNSQKEIETLCKKCYDEFFEKTKLPSVRLSPIGTGDETDTNMKNRTKTKLGGNPYWPKDDEFPTYKGHPMMLLAQLNFSELPNLPGFPTTGLLQFFCGTWDESDRKDIVEVVYHEKLLPESEMLVDIPDSPLRKEDPPIGGMYLVNPSKEEVPMSSTDEKFTETITPIYNRLSGENVDDIWNANRAVRNALWDLIYNDNCGGTRFGGHPYFVQNDYRDDDDEVMLLQLDSESGMMWGDCGIASFFISKSDLASKKFKGTVKFTWSCF